MEQLTIAEQNGLTLEAVSATLLYTVVGIIILTMAVMALNKVFGLQVRKELLKDQNTAVGIVIAGLSVSIAIIIAGTIGS